MVRAAHRLSAMASVALLLTLFPSAAAAAPGASSPPSFAAGAVLVGFKPGTPPEQVRAIVGAVGAIDQKVIGAGTHKLAVPTGNELGTIAALKLQLAVRYAEPDFTLRADAEPNDPMFNQLWGLQNTGQRVPDTPLGFTGTPGADIHAVPAWTVTTGTAAVVVGVVDTGIDYLHEDLAANVWSNPDGVGGCPAETHGFNAILGTCDPRDDNNHGTHVSGTIGAVGNNGTGVTGINWTTSLMGLKFLNAVGSGFTSDAITAIDFAVQAKLAGVNVRALSNSWGGGGFSQALLDEIDWAGANDILFVAAAGNSSADNDVTPTYPCAYPSEFIVCVAATDQDDNLASFSNFGATTVHLGAPGVRVLSTTIGNTYNYFSGTSMATPHVTGAAALILSTGYLPVTDLKATLLAAVDPDPALADITVTGGRLNICKAIPGCVP